ncbi:DUF1254 domain-containing protein [Actinotalea sp. M2MS4P-6]|uniref:DUF1254 domain-containing protein n=1 Tax=Actinotalea sp. M2MS4P-6 TaxID=2983762 RepID=UPI0021E4A11F|nr:DUF1254 domain-containing protein [Actinotalea sp. M2MS4P-6]MCV2396140.1 DUF1254 domain-containing protein [Actinotalea sp. M2MS4P-6]
MTVTVSVDNFVRAETARMLDATAQRAGGVNRWWHLRGPVPLDAQTVIRMNRDTLYSSAVLDLREGAELTIPDPGDRYLSVMVINEDHYINRLLRDPGTHRLTVEEYDTEFVAVAARIFADPDDPADVSAVNRLQDGLRIDAGAAGPYTHPDYDPASLDATRELLLRLGAGVPDSRRTFGSAGEVDPVRHLTGTAIGWGGLPESEAYYAIETAPRPVGHRRIEFRDVPVDAFWSFSVYDRDGYFAANPADRYSFNSVTAAADDDGAVVIDLDTEDRGYRNHLYVMDGWNYAIRFYRPRAEILDGRWTPPVPVPAD